MSVHPIWRAVFVTLGCLLVTWESKGQPFTEVPHSMPGMGTGSIAWGDYDADGDLDLLITGFAGNNWVPITRLYRNTGGSFEEINAGLPAGKMASMAWGDYDHDGDLDLALAGTSTSIFQQTNGMFLERLQLHPVEAQKLLWGDHDRDGDLDLLAFSFVVVGGRGTVFRNDQHDHFLNLGGDLPEVYNPQLAWKDFDLDGDLDILVSGTLPNTATRTTTLSTYYGGSWWLPTVLSPLDGLATGDFENDGDLDLLVVSGTHVQLVTNNLAKFGYVPGDLATTIRGAVSWGDFDNDGYQDALVNVYDNGANVIQLHRNLAGQSFTNVLSLRAGVGIVPDGIADFDNDGDLDLLCMDTLFASPALKLFRNDTTNRNTSPTAPTGLNATVAGERVTLKWNAATDANQGSGLTYNLRIGTRPGAIDVAVPMSDLETGFRQVPEAGNNGTLLTRTFYLLPGNYYWSVQAVDHSFAGSEFSAEATFTVPKPVLRGLPASVVIPAGWHTNISFTLLAYGTPVDTVSLTASAASTELVPTNGLTFSGEGTNRMLTITAARHARGTTRVSVVATDTNGLTATHELQVRVEDSFTEIEVPFPMPGGSPSDSLGLWADFDNDGRLDVLLLGQSQETNRTLLLHNSGNGTFTRVTTLLPSLPGRPRAAVADYDNDGDVDLLVAGFNGAENVLGVYRNEGNYDFTLQPAELPVFGGAAVAWADLDSDGRQDALISGATGLTDVLVTDAYRNSSAGQFAPWNAGFTPTQYGHFAPADVDRDGAMDLLVMGGGIASPAFTHFYRNLLSAGFEQAHLELPPLTLGFGAWGDVNSDGLLDLALGGLLTNGTAYVRVHQNSGVDLASSIGGVNAANYPSFAWGDYDNDGLADLAVTGGYMTRVYHNAGEGGFVNSAANLMGASGSVAWGDYDRDGDLDLLVVGTTGTHLARIYRNDTPHRMPQPEPPGVLSNDFLSDGSVELRWTNPAQTTNAAALQYNVRVGTTPGSVDIVSPHAHPLTGVRQLAGLGNGSSSNRFLVRSLGKGTYYWSVQAIDPAWATSVFSSEARFTITNTPPVISAPTNYVLSHGGGPQQVPFVVVDEDTPPSELQVTAVSLNTDMLPTENLLVTGTDSNRFLEVTPVLNNLGTARVILQAADTAGLISTRRIDLVFSNYPPIVSGLSTQFFSTTVNVPTAPIHFLVGDRETTPGEILVRARSSNTNVIPETNIVITSSNEHRWITLTPSRDAVAFSILIDLIATDPNGATGTGRFFVGVINPPPVISSIPDVYATRGDPVPPVVFWVSDPDSEDTNLVVTVTSANPILVSSNGLSVSGTGTNRALVITPNAEQSGHTLLRLRVTDRLGATVETSFLLIVERPVIGVAELPYVAEGAAAWADYDNDGWLDLLLGGRTTNNYPILFLYHNNGDGTFSNARAGFAGLTTPRVSWADFDRDGYVDLLASGASLKSSSTRIYRNLAGLSFTNFGAFPELPPRQVSGMENGFWVDFDSDGDLEVIGNSSDTIHLYQWEGGEWMLRATNVLPRMRPTNVQMGDFDRDGDNDLLVSGRLPNQQPISRVFRNDGGVFTNASVTLTNSSSGGAWGDYDADGWLDVLLGANSDSTTSYPLVFHNAGDGTFAPVTTTNLSRVANGGSAWADLDNDGSLDAVFAGRTFTSNLTHVYRYTGSNTFTSWLSFPGVGVDSRGAGPGDFDRDGDLDLPFIGSPERIWINFSAVSNSPPTAPSNLVSEVLPVGRVLLSWSPAQDRETTNSAGLRYNLRVGRSPGGIDVLAPHADVTTGLRRVVDFGNAGPAPFWVLRLLPGTYYWSVQAIDASQTASPFAPEATLQVPEFPPVMLRAYVPSVNTVGVNLQGEPLRSYQLEVSTNLINWSPGPAVQAGWDGTASLVEPRIGTQKFYRAKLGE